MENQNSSTLPVSPLNQPAPQPYPNQAAPANPTPLVPSSALTPSQDQSHKEEVVRDNNQIVHAIRVLVKVGMVAFLFISGTPNAAVLSSYILLSEVADQLLLIMGKTRPAILKWLPYFYIVNSVAVISVVGYFAQWILNDYYLIYLIHASSATLAYGTRIGLLSFILSVLVYSTLLFYYQSPIILYLRLPLVSIIALRLLISQNRFEKIGTTLSNILSVEKSKQDFIGLASHNLRTPVAAIYGYIEILLRGDAGPLNQSQTTFLQKVKSNNQELEKLTEQLLQISILEVGKKADLLLQPSQIEVLIEDTVEKFLNDAQAKGLNLSFRKPDHLLPLVNIDVEKIRAVITNLIDNAIKYTEKGSVTVTADLESDLVVINVKDTGMGIPQEELPKIFSKFYRSGSILVYNKTGVGLGLYLGKQIIELHGGQMTVDSIEGHGTTFTFTLPIIKEKLLE